MEEKEEYLFLVCLTEPPVTRFSSRRKSVFAETYNPEEDEDDDEGAKVDLAHKLEFFLLLMIYQLCPCLLH
jgi:hypothetical protein